MTMKTIVRFALGIGVVAALGGCASDAPVGPSCDEICEYHESCGSTAPRAECVETCESDYRVPEEAGCRAEQAALFECNMEAGCTVGVPPCEDARHARNDCVCATNPDYWACGSI